MEGSATADRVTSFLLVEESQADLGEIASRRPSDFKPAPSSHGFEVFVAAAA